MSKEKMSEAIEEVAAEEATAASAAVPRSTKELLDAEERVPVLVPRTPGDEREFIPVFINEMTYQVALEREVMVPRSVAEVIRNRQAAETRARVQLEEARRKLAQNPNGGVY